MATPFLVPADQAAFLLNILVKLFHAGFGFDDMIGPHAFSRADIQFLEQHNLAGLAPDDVDAEEFDYVNVEGLKQLAQNAEIAPRHVVIMATNPFHSPWYNEVNTRLRASLPPLTDYPYITVPKDVVTLDAGIKGARLNLYDLLMAMRALNRDAWRTVAEELQVFTRGPDLWELEIDLDPDT